MQANSSPTTHAERRRFLKAAAAATALGGFHSLPKAWAAPSRRYGPVGLSLNVGLNLLDRDFYGYAPQLEACGNDAVALAEIAEQEDFQDPRVLFDDEANYEEVRRHIRAAADVLEDGDFFL